MTAVINSHTIGGKNKKHIICVRNSVLVISSFYDGVELKRVRLGTNAAAFYNWLGKELGVQQCSAKLQGQATDTSNRDLNQT